MLLFVICFNFGLALGNIFLAVKLYSVYRQLQRLTKRLDHWEHCCHNLFAPAPAMLSDFTAKNRQIRQKYHLFLKRWSMVKGILQIWQWNNGSLWWVNLANE
ncbi:hypothetical protein [Synechocystis sp. PCC 6714]|uniref:hypothetical protein n=1 Tax=Synechocystis sp. (strain PCC 6714) TaxID=1147 RepID=UPI00048DED33|nr:hypothetical protein [Synechocystis sp. PCC 6714]AIE73303.1 hypothetical protein D082_07740 [Synechocystis sp. PCC 6714]